MGLTGAEVEELLGPAAVPELAWDVSRLRDGRMLRLFLEFDDSGYVERVTLAPEGSWRPHRADATER